jgi:transglutaminase-like putative cysteine protease
MRIMKLRPVVVVLATAVIGCGGSSPDGAASGAGTVAASVSGNPAASGVTADTPSVLRDFGARFPAELTNLEALAASLKTPAAAFAFVRNQVAFEPYRGVMKGAQQTLVTRGGNAIDRALLLAALLRAQGVQSSIASGELSQAQAAALIAQIARRPAAVELVAASVPTAVKATRADQSPRDQILKAPTSRAAANLKDAEASIQAVSAAFDRAGKRPSPRVDAADSVRTHYWVRANLPGGVTDLDPTLEAATEGSRMTELRQTYDSPAVPAAQHQRLSLRVVAEYVEAGSIRSIELVTAEATAADLAGKALRFVVAPTKLAREQNEFGVQLVLGDAKPAGATFLVRSTSGPKRTIADMLGGGDDPADSPTLGRLSLEVRSHAPGMSDLTYRRVIADRLNDAGNGIRPDMRNDDSIRSLLLQAWDGMLDVGAVHPAELVAIRLKTAEAQQSMLQRARNETQPFGLDALAPPTLSPLVAGFLYFSGLGHAQVLNTHGSGSRVYHIRPRVAFLRNGLAVHDWTQAGVSRRFQRSIDLLNAPFGIAGPQTDSANLALRLGVADANLERSFSRPGEEFTTIALLRAGESQRVPATIVHPGDDAVVGGLDLPSEIISVLRAELRHGRTLILPRSLIALNEVRTYGWWGFDSESGVPLGQMELGAGQAGVEIAPLTRKVMEMTQLIITFYGNILGCFFMEAAGQLGDTTGPDSPFGAIKLAPVPKGGRSLAQCILTNACEALVGYTMLAATSYAPAFVHNAIAELTEMIIQMLIAEFATVQGCAGL